MECMGSERFLGVVQTMQQYPCCWLKHFRLDRRAALLATLFLVPANLLQDHFVYNNVYLFT